VHQVVDINAVNGPPTTRWKDVFFENSWDLRERTLATFLQAQPAKRDPLIKHCFKDVLCRITNRATLLFTMFIRIDALSNQGTRLITASRRLFGKRRVKSPWRKEWEVVALTQAWAMAIFSSSFWTWSGLDKSLASPLEALLSFQLPRVTNGFLNDWRLLWVGFSPAYYAEIGQ
jgi:hypothetical protein